MVFCCWTSELEPEDSPISLVEVSDVVKKLLSGKVPAVDDIHPKMLKALDIVGLSWLTRLFDVAWRSGTVTVEWQTRVVAPIFKKGGLEGALQLSRYRRAASGVMGVCSSNVCVFCRLAEGLRPCPPGSPVGGTVVSMEYQGYC